MNESWIREAARLQLGIEDEQRLQELEALSGLLEMIRDTMPTDFPGETPPALRFKPGEQAPDFWGGLESADE